jgi:hypothetical protein
LGFDAAVKKARFSLDISVLFSIGAFPKTGGIRFGTLSQRE